MATTTRLQDAVVALARFLHDCVEGVTDAAEGDRQHMRDTRRRVAQQNAYKLSEVLFLDGPPGLTGNNPKAVLSYDAQAGRFVLNDPYGPASGVPTGVHYALLNLGGAGTTYLGYLSGINLALAALLGAWEGYLDLDRPAEGPVVVEVPEGLDSVHGVSILSTEGTLAQVKPGRGGWEIEQPRTLRLGSLGGTRGTLRVYGRVYGPWVGPGTPLETLLPANIAEVVTVASEYVVRDSARPREMSLGMQLNQERLRTRPPVRHPSEVLLGRSAVPVALGLVAAPAVAFASR